MMTWLSTFALGRGLLKVPAWAWVLLGCLLLMLVVYRQGVGAGKADKAAELAPRIEALERDLSQARRNNAALESAIAAQNAAVAAAGQKAAEARARAAEAEKRAAESRKRLSGIQGRLSEETRQTGGKPAIALTPAQAEAWEMLR